MRGGPPNGIRESFDNFRDDVQSGLHARRDGLQLVPFIGLGDLILAQALGALQGVGHGDDIGGVDGAHFLDEGKDIGEIALIVIIVLLVDGKAGQMSDSFDVSFIQHFVFITCYIE